MTSIEIVFLSFSIAVHIFAVVTIACLVRDNKAMLATNLNNQ